MIRDHGINVSAETSIGLVAVKVDNEKIGDHVIYRVLMCPRNRPVYATSEYMEERKFSKTSIKHRAGLYVSMAVFDRLVRTYVQAWNEAVRQNLAEEVWTKCGRGGQDLDIAKTASAKGIVIDESMCQSFKDMTPGDCRYWLANFKTPAWQIRDAVAEQDQEAL